MEIVKQYKYLGEFINVKENETVTIEKRIKEAAGIMARIMAVTRSEELQHKKIQVIIRLAKPCPESQPLYKSETWFNIGKKIE